MDLTVMISLKIRQQAWAISDLYLVPAVGKAGPESSMFPRARLHRGPEADGVGC